MFESAGLVLPSVYLALDIEDNYYPDKFVFVKKNLRLKMHLCYKNYKLDLKEYDNCLKVTKNVEADSPITWDEILSVWK